MWRRAEADPDLTVGNRIGIDIKPYPAADHRYFTTKSSVIP